MIAVFVWGAGRSGTPAAQHGLMVFKIKLRAQQSVCWIMVVIHAAGVTTPRVRHVAFARSILF